MLKYYIKVYINLVATQDCSKNDNDDDDDDDDDDDNDNGNDNDDDHKTEPIVESMSTMNER